MLLIIFDICLYFFKLEYKMLVYLFVDCGWLSMIWVCVVRLVIGVFSLWVMLVEKWDSCLNLFLSFLIIVLKDFIRLVSFIGILVGFNLIFNLFVVMELILWLRCCKGEWLW